MSERDENKAAASGDWSNVHPDFDGHLELPLERMTTQQRLEWLWQMVQFQHWARSQARMLPPDGDRGSGKKSL